MRTTIPQAETISTAQSQQFPALEPNNTYNASSNRCSDRHPAHQERHGAPPAGPSTLPAARTDRLSDSPPAGRSRMQQSSETRLHPEPDAQHAEGGAAGGEGPLGVRLSEVVAESSSVPVGSRAAQPPPVACRIVACTAAWLYLRTGVLHEVVAWDIPAQ